MRRLKRGPEDGLSAMDSRRLTAAGNLAERLGRYFEAATTPDVRRRMTELVNDALLRATLRAVCPQGQAAT